MIIEDPEFRSKYNKTEDWDGTTDYTDGYSGNDPGDDWIYQAWSSCDWFYNTNLSIDLVPLIIDLYEFEETNMSSTDAKAECIDRAKDLLKLGNDWDLNVPDPPTPLGDTSPENHGFDLLWCAFGEVGNTTGKNLGIGSNTLIRLRYYNNSNLNDSMFRVMQHELGHIFYALHVPEDENGNGQYEEGHVSIMGAEDYFNFNTHEFVLENRNRVIGNAGIFNGPN